MKIDIRFYFYFFENHHIKSKQITRDDILDLLAPLEVVFEDYVRPYCAFKMQT